MTALGLLTALLLVLVNGFFVGAEFSLISVRRSQVEPLAAGSRRARIVLDALTQVPLMLAAAQLGVTLASLGLGAVAEPSVAALLEPALDAVAVPHELLHPVSLAVALAVVVFAHTVLGEMVPKNLSLAAPEKAALAFVPPLVRFARLTAPLLRLLNVTAYGLLRLVGVSPREEMTSSYSPEELADIIAESRSEGLLEPEEHERLAGALALRHTCAADVMVTFDRLVTVPDTTTAEDLEQLVVVTGYSRFPVRSAADDPVTATVAEGGLLGFVHVKDILGLTAAQRRRPLPASLLRPMPRLDAQTSLTDVLTALRRSRSHLAQVVDPRGVVGVLALEDVVEQFVGEVEDATNPLNAPALSD
jgi:CBS domain containing-hemolysin-like protein